MIFVSQIPNVYTGLAPVDMSMLMPKTGLAVNLPNALGGGFNMRVVLPKTKMTMDAEHPASYELTTSAHQDLIIALIVPMLLALLTLPFTLLRVILLGWNCSLARQKVINGEKLWILKFKFVSVRNGMVLMPIHQRKGRRGDLGEVEIV